jgi:hypothetical protein
MLLCSVLCEVDLHFVSTRLCFTYVVHSVLRKSIAAARTADCSPTRRVSVIQEISVADEHVRNRIPEFCFLHHLMFRNETTFSSFHAAPPWVLARLVV